MVIAEPPWLRAWADGFAVLLLLELIILLVVVAALMGALAYGAYWLRQHVIPLLNATVPRALQALDVANTGTAQVTRGVAEVYGIRRGLETGLRVMVRGPQATPAPGTHATTSPPARSHGETSPPALSRGEREPPTFPPAPLSQDARGEPDANDTAPHAG
jgi:hypothetical protein